MLELIGSVTPLATMATGVLVPLFFVCWSIYAFASGRQGGFTAIKAIVSLLVWVLVSYAMFVMFFIGSYLGGASPNPRDLGNAHQGNIVLLISCVVYMAIGYGLAVWVRGKPRSAGPSEPVSGDDVKRRLDAGLEDLHPKHRAYLQAIRFAPRPVAITHSPGEFVYAVAKRDTVVLYWSVAEHAWHLATVDSSGGIAEPGRHESDLSGAMWQLAGDPKALP